METITPLAQKPITYLTDQAQLTSQDKQAPSAGALLKCWLLDTYNSVPGPFNQQFSSLNVKAAC
jgi:hypothetical protein